MRELPLPTMPLAELPAGRRRDFCRAGHPRRRRRARATAAVARERLSVGWAAPGRGARSPAASPSGVRGRDGRRLSPMNGHAEGHDADLFGPTANT